MKISSPCNGRHPENLRPPIRGTASNLGRPGRAKIPGFSLLEVLAAMAVLALVAVMILGILDSTREGTSKIVNVSRQRQDAMGALLLMARELQSALRPPGLSMELLPGTAILPVHRQPQLVINPSGIATELVNATTIFWSAGSISGAGKSHLVGYAVIWRQTENGTRPTLARLQLDSNQAQEALMNYRHNSTQNFWVTNDLVTSTAPATQDAGFAGWLADNVLALYVRALDPEMKPIRNQAREVLSYYAQESHTIAPSLRFRALATAPPVFANGGFDSRRGYRFVRSDNTIIDRYGPALPPAVEIALVVVEPRLLRRGSNFPRPTWNGDPAQMWQNIDSYVANLQNNFGPGFRVYSTIVPILSQQ